MRYLSVCSGIEAASVAWPDWQPVAFSEIDPFPCAVLAHHYPGVPNWGDMTLYKEWPDADVDVLVGGTPCQSFSVAGLRKGMDDPRGNLALVYLGIADRYRPEWLVWENVPGVLSSGGGRDFGSFLGGLGELGYGFAYRVLDAQYFGLAQRRKRVFVVGCLGGWQRAAAVLFEPSSLRGDSAPSREAGKSAPTIPSRRTAGGGLGTDFDCDGGLIAGTLRAHHGNPQLDQTMIPAVSPALKARDYKGPSSDGDGDGAPLIVHALRGEGFDASEDGAGRGTPLVPCIGFQSNAGSQGGDVYVEQSPTLRSQPTGGGGMPAVAHAFDARQSDVIQYGDKTGPLDTDGHTVAVAFHENQRAEVSLNDTVGALNKGGGKPGQGYPAVMQQMAVRRLTPRECERLQGFPDGYTRIPIKTYERRRVTKTRPEDRWEKADDGRWTLFAGDGPRYKALGNSMAVPVMRWIGQRIQNVTNGATA